MYVYIHTCTYITFLVAVTERRLILAPRYIPSCQQRHGGRSMVWLITLYLCSENKKKNVDAWLVFSFLFSAGPKLSK